MHREARNIFELMVDSREFFKYTWNNNDIILINKYITGEKKLFLTINHEIQFNNAIRHDGIDKNKIYSVKQKLESFNSHEQQAAFTLNNFIKSHKFLQISSYNKEINNKPLPKFIPHPSQLYSRTVHVDELSDSQHIEYVNTFSDLPSLSLIRKYQHVRLTNLLQFYIFNFNQIDSNVIIREIQLIIDIQRYNIRKTPTHYGEELLLFIKYTKSPHRKKIQERLELWQKLEIESVRIQDKIKKDIFYGNHYECKKKCFPIRITPSLDFYAIAQGSFKNLQSKVNVLSSC